MISYVWPAAAKCVYVTFVGSVKAQKVSVRGATQKIKLGDVSFNGIIYILHPAQL